jgi:hypothetical protein
MLIQKITNQKHCEVCRQQSFHYNNGACGQCYDLLTSLAPNSISLEGNKTKLRSADIGHYTENIRHYLVQYYVGRKLDVKRYECIIGVNDSTTISFLGGLQREVVIPVDAQIGDYVVVTQLLDGWLSGNYGNCYRIPVKSRGFWPFNQLELDFDNCRLFETLAPVVRQPNHWLVTLRVHSHSLDYQKDRFYIVDSSTLEGVLEIASQIEPIVPFFTKILYSVEIYRLTTAIPEVWSGYDNSLGYSSGHSAISGIGVTIYNTRRFESFNELWRHPSVWTVIKSQRKPKDFAIQWS